MPDTAKVQGLLFDVYGTLFDVHSVVQLCEQLFPGKGAALSHLWRTKQLEYTWQRSLMQRYEPFHQVTRSALRVACRALGLEAPAAVLDQLTAAYLQLKPYPDTLPALQRLKGVPLAVFSNGSLQMLGPLLAHAGIEKYMSHVISVDEIRIFKPDPRVYQLGCARVGLEAPHVAPVSSNFWDISGARAFGMQALWINRTGAGMDDLGFEPTATYASLTQLADALSTRA
jgi:2-haloacid dehalogenase